MCHQSTQMVLFTCQHVVQNASVEDCFMQAYEMPKLCYVMELSIHMNPSWLIFMGYKNLLLYHASKF